MTERMGGGYVGRATRLDRYWREWQATADSGPETSMLEAQTLRTLYKVSDFVGWQREGMGQLARCAGLLC